MRGGYFVELGALDGITDSQCFYFEEKLQWDGIAVEPQQQHRDALTKRRKKPCYDAVGDASRVVQFAECVGNSYMSGVVEKRQMHKTGQMKFVEYEVQMSPLLDLLDRYEAPVTIHYCGIDIEGSTSLKIAFTCAATNACKKVTRRRN